eukprot:Hpha_TRINITY_DN8842_c0_g1::TRINITY_DN8842_c0_g1_i2::g.141409::m.141409
MYSFHVGPRTYLGSQISAGAAGGEDMQFLFPFSRRWREFTVEGKEVEVIFSRQPGYGAGAPVLETCVPAEYAVSAVAGAVLFGGATYIAWRRFFLMMKLFSLHNTEEGAQLIRRAAHHHASGTTGPDPVHRWLYSAWPLTASASGQQNFMSLNLMHEHVRGQGQRVRFRSPFDKPMDELEEEVRAEEFFHAEAAKAEETAPEGGAEPRGAESSEAVGSEPASDPTRTEPAGAGTPDLNTSDTEKGGTSARGAPPATPSS